MAKECSFDVVSKVDFDEVRNAVNMAMKEITTRFDFKNSVSKIEFDGAKLVLHSDDEGKLRSVTDILETKLVKRKVAVKALQFGKVESALGGTVRQEVGLANGIPSEKAKEISKAVRDSKLKVQASIQGDAVRIIGKNKDDLQKVMGLLREADHGIPLQFTNYR